MITPAEYAAAVLPELRRAGIPVVLEPGRAVVGHSGALVARVVDTKRYPDGRQFAVLDAGHDRADAARRSTARSIASCRCRRAPAAESAVGHRRADLREQRRVRARSVAAGRCEVGRPASRCSTPAPTARSWPRTTTAACCAPEVLVDDGAVDA